MQTFIPNLKPNRMHFNQKFSTHHISKFFIAFFIISLAFTFTAAASIPVVKITYVKAIATGDGTGSSWDNATSDLQSAINASGTNDEVWVAGGTYLPLYMAGNGTTDRHKAFVLKKDVKVYGGFAGTETVLTDRDLTLTANASILSGDLGTISNNSDNAYHVVISAGDAGVAELNGFTIKDGNSNSSDNITVNTKTIYSDSGGGIYNVSSSPILTNVTISGNTAT